MTTEGERYPDTHDPERIALDALALLRDAYRHGHRGPAMLRRWAMARNGERHNPHGFVSTAVLNEAITLERGERP